jgi:hypothetical protein
MATVHRYPVWQNPYFAAILEMDAEKMKVRITDAENAIHRRMIKSSADPEERQAALDALNALSFLGDCVN